MELVPVINIFLLKSINFFIKEILFFFDDFLFFLHDLHLFLLLFKLSHHLFALFPLRFLSLDLTLHFLNFVVQVLDFFLVSFLCSFHFLFVVVLLLLEVLTVRMVRLVDRVFVLSSEGIHLFALFDDFVSQRLFSHAVLCEGVHFSDDFVEVTSAKLD